MKIIDKILIALCALFFAIGAFAEIQCVRETNGTWVCYGDGASTETVITNFVGTCTNCVQMTPELCREAYSNLDRIGRGINDKFMSVSRANAAAHNSISNIINEISSFGQVTGNQSVDYMSQYYTQAQYCKDPRGGDNVGGWSVGDNYNRNYYAVCINSIYNYAQDVSQDLLTADNNLKNNQILLSGRDFNGQSTTEDNKNSILFAMDDLGYYIQQINCDTCNNGSGSGDDDSGGGGGGGNQCPCAEQFELLKGLAQDIDDVLTKMNNHIVDISNMVFRVKNDVIDIAEHSTYITNFVHRLDDYVFDEYTNQVYKIYDKVNWLGELLRSDYSNDYQTISWGVIDSWRRANTFSEYHGDDSPFDNSQDRFNFLEKGRDIFSTTNNNSNVAFDTSLYQNYNWFQRIEFLLGSVAGVFSQGGDGTNDVDRINDFTAAQKAQIDSAQSTYDALENSLDTPKEIIEGWVSSYQDKIDSINPFKAIKDVATDNVDSIKFLPEGEYDISDDFSIKIPEIALKVGGEGFERGQAVPYLSNIIFNFLWWVIGFIGVGLLLWWFVIQLFKVLEFFHKVHLSWAHTLHLR